MARNKVRRYGTRAEVMSGTARMTQGRLTKADFTYNEQGRIVSKKKSIKMKGKENPLKKQKYLQTKNIPDPDLLIRTGNTKRLSNFLLWQIAYSEIFFEKKFWPAFNEKDFNRIIKNYKSIKRNFGSI